MYVMYKIYVTNSRTGLNDNENNQLLALLSEFKRNIDYFPTIEMPGENGTDKYSMSILILGQAKNGPNEICNKIFDSFYICSLFHIFDIFKNQKPCKGLLWCLIILFKQNNNVLWFLFVINRYFKTSDVYIISFILFDFHRNII